MKKVFALVLTVLMLITSCLSAFAEFDPSGLTEWMSTGGSNGANTAGFLAGEENRPSKAEMETILSLANTYFQCHSLTGTHFVVIQGMEEQQQIMGMFTRMGLDCSGTVMVLVMADGVKDQEHHAAQYYPGSRSENGGNPEYWNMYYGIYEAGWASGYLNLVAASMGYRCRAYAAISIPNVELGAVDLQAGGKFEYITGENWDIEKYMTSKDGTVAFDHYSEALKDVIPCEGNVTLLCAILIGRIDEADAATGATSNNPVRMQNYDFWDWEDAEPAAEETAETDAATAATAPAEPEAEADAPAEAQ